ncbi:very long chain fatty acid elongase 1-like [Lasioglossum baleicum]|uniref:very long chain fatty acid elongase 1-like n=1 Tax=Lasioglossum baleicum TaxID=434251 RepID=UPI003FCCC9D0
MGLLETYDYYWNQMPDPRTNDLPFVRSPVLIPAILISYLYFVVKCGPRYMKDRKPYDLKTFVRYYNIFQVISNAYIVTRLLALGLITEISVICSIPDYSYDPIPLQISFIFWLALQLKLIDLVETAVFVLRKKDRQISFLHLYHHVSTVLITWLITKYIPVALAGFVMVVNSTVHVVMYTYYYFSAMGDKAPKILNTVKPLITVMQMVQFIILMLQNIITMVPSCPVPRLPAIVSIINLSINFILFYNFYRKNYPPAKKVK